MNKMDDNIVDILLDDDNEDNIILFDEEDNEVEFEQAAVLDYKGKVYAILIPLDEEAEEDEAVVFEINEKQGTIEMVEDDDIADAVIDLYNKEIEKDEKK